MLKYSSGSDKETVELGKRLGTILTAGDAVALIGKLGSGKTWFTKGIALGFDVDSREVITSPSFSIVNEYKGRCTLYHMDLYRLENWSDMLSIGLEDYFKDESVVIVEWADRCMDIMPEKRIDVRFDILDGNRRSISIEAEHPRTAERITVI